MPTVLWLNGFRFFFYSNDHKPKHIHIEKDGKTAKFNIEPIELIKSKRFNASEMKKVRMMVEDNVELFNLRWNEYFNNKQVP